MKRLLILLQLSCLLGVVHAQMQVNNNTLYGNEWIDYAQEYYKMYVVEDGVYRIPYQTLIDAGVPVNNISADNFQLYVMGEELPVYISTSGTLGSNDYIEFYGKKNKGEMDAHFYETPEDQFNPHYSIYTDTAAYFLTWNTLTNNSRLSEIPNDLTNLPAPESYFMHESYNVQFTKYNKGKTFEQLYESIYSAGEGYGGPFAQTRNYALATPDVYLGGPDAEYQIRFVGSNGADHQIELKVGGVSQTVSSPVFSGYEMRELTDNIPVNILSNSTIIKLEGLLGSTDRYATAFAKIKYPHKFLFGNTNSFLFRIDADPANRKYLEIEDFNYNGLAPVLYDLTNGLRINTTISGTTVQAALPVSAEERTLVLFDENNSVTTIDEVYPVDFVNYDTEQGDYILVSHDKFLSDPGNYIQTYADYRATTGYNPIIIDIEELYDQFAYGVNKHAQAIRNFTGFTLMNWATPPKYMFMIGKARPANSVRNNNPASQPSYTPTFGHNPSDLLLTATVDSHVPRISFGRIPILQAAEVGIYLDKVMSYESNQEDLPQTIEDRAWMKRIVHLGGGDPYIQNEIKQNFSNYRDIAESDYFGGDVHSFFKSSEEPVEIIVSEFLDSLINEGTKLVTFYGHSSPEALDFNIDGPESYTNTDRYFVMFSLGCYSGQIHQKEPNLSEWFVFAEEKGAVAFLATLDLSELESLDAFADAFYDQMTGDNYGEGLGDIIQGAVADLQASGVGVDDQIVYQQMTLNGDPALRINEAEAPDYIVNEPTITFGPEILTNTENFEISFTITNIGKAVPDSFAIQIDRILPNGTEITVIESIEETPKFEQTYKFTIPYIASATGLNQFRITVDSDEDISELPNPDAEDNNVAYAEALIKSNVVDPTIPRDFSIEPDLNGIVLKAEIESAYINTSLDYLIEIDTTELFDSPLKESTMITTQPGDVELKWIPPVSYVDSTVYYWRVRVDAAQIPNAAEWKGCSFITLENEYPGWNQSHYYQYKKDRFSNITYETDRRFEFVTSYNEVAVTSAHYPTLPLNQMDYAINGSRVYDAMSCEVEEQGIYFAFFDENFNVYGNIQVNSNTNQGLYNSYLCSSPAFTFLFPTDNLAGQNYLRNMLNNVIPTFPYVKYILIYSLNDYEPETWNANLFDAFANYGLTEIQNTASIGGVPYAALVEVDGNSYEDMAASETDILEAAFALPDSWDKGTVESTIIGPATEWVSLHWDVNEQEAEDEVKINVYGIDTNDEATLLETVTDPNHSFDAAIYDVTQYPYLKLEYDAMDESNKTAAQLNYWRVLYDDCFKINVKIALEGPYDTGSGFMNTNLNTERKILPGQTPTAPTATPTPAGQPYSIMPWNYMGIEGDNFTDEDYSESVVDWVMISLRTDIDPATEVLRTTGLLLRNGIIDIVEPCVADPALIGDFYIVVEHRNHMGVMSPQKVAVVNNQITYDFRTENSFISNNSIGFGQKELMPGVWGMYAGDMNQAAEITSYDINSIDKVEWTTENGFFDVYLPSDLNFDGDANALDKIFWEYNNGTFSSVPK